MTRRTIDLPPALAGERRTLESRVGPLSYYAAEPLGDKAGGPPLLLVHSVNAAATAYEVRPLYEHYRALRPVYAPDLPGFGFSDRSPRRYTPRLMTDALHVMAEEIRRRHRPARFDALALSLSCEFLARAANEAEDDAFRSLAFVSPTGFSGEQPRPGPPDATLGKPLLYRVFAFPLWRRAFFDLLTSRASIRYFLRKTWGASAIDEGLFEYDYLTARHPGAHHAPYDFVSGFLFSAGAARLYRSLRLPVWMAHGVRGDFTDYRRKSDFEALSNWRIEVFETGALPHFERLNEVVTRYDAFLASLAR